MITAFKTMVENFYHWEANTPNNIYLSQPVGDEYIDFTFKETGNQARRMAAALRAMNLPEKSHIGIVSKNCAHWIISDLAIMMAGHISVPFYATLVAEQLNQVLVHSECKVLFVGKLDNWKGMKDGIPASVKCIAYPSFYEGSPSTEMDEWSNIINAHEPLQENVEPKDEDIATIIYTSGTTGVPKGVMLTFGATVSALHYTRNEVLLNTENARFFSYLPLCHIAERNIVESASMATGGRVFFADTLESFSKNLQTAMPTHFLAVPRIWTKFQQGILAKMPQSRLDLLLKIPFIKAVIKGKIQKGLGLADAKVILTGAAPMPSALLDWYKKLGITIREAYGMSENVGAHSMMPADAVKNGTVGKPYEKVITRIDPDTGEIQMKAPWNTLGYYKEPILTEGLFKDGYLCTGDMGEVDSEGYLKITGRVKDMFKSAKGEYIVPAPIENMLAVNPILEQVCVVGAGLSQPIVLVVLSDIGKNMDRQNVIDSLETTLKRVNPSFKSYEALSKAIVVKEAWSIENNLLTPTMKIKRNIVEKHYQDKIEQWAEIREQVVFE
ncbi:MAG: AMP-binding protein [Arcicella sp.]|nr:AMP-binding protein [Arcicella sp.]